jgi:hypothetical protein
MLKRERHAPEQEACATFGSACLVSQEAPPARDRLPTIPHDLSELARLQTGPSADAYDDPLGAMAAGEHCGALAREVVALLQKLAT